MRLSFFCLVAAVLVCWTAAPPARAEYSRSVHNRVSRWTGYGWSEGYHAYDECPSCRRHLLHLGRPCSKHDAYFGPDNRFTAQPPLPPWDAADLLKSLGLSTGNRGSVVKPQPAVPVPAPTDQPPAPLPAPLPKASPSDLPPQTTPPGEEARLRPLELVPASAIRVISPPYRPGRYPISR